MCASSTTTMFSLMFSCRHVLLQCCGDHRGRQVLRQHDVSTSGKRGHVAVGMIGYLQDVEGTCPRNQ